MCQGRSGLGEGQRKGVGHGSESLFVIHGFFTHRMTSNRLKKFPTCWGWEGTGQELSSSASCSPLPAAGVNQKDECCQQRKT